MTTVERKSTRGRKAGRGPSLAIVPQERGGEAMLEKVIRDLAKVRSIDSARLPQLLDQDFLAELWLQKRSCAIEARRYRGLVKQAVAAIRAGAEIEPGLHEIRIVEVKRGRGKFLRVIIA